MRYLGLGNEGSGMVTVFACFGLWLVLSGGAGFWIVLRNLPKRSVNRRLEPHQSFYGPRPPYAKQRQRVDAQ
jgi:hypothetical protein